MLRRVRPRRGSVEHQELHVAVATRKSSERRLLHLSDELLAAVLGAADAPGVMYRLLQVNKHVSELLRDETWPTWRSLAHRMSTWVPKIHTPVGVHVSTIATGMLTKAAARIGGWRSLCHEKDAYDPRHLALPTDSPVDWPPGRWYPLTPHEEQGLFDTILHAPPRMFPRAALPSQIVSPQPSPAIGPHQAPLSLVFLLDGSGSMTPCFRGVKRFIRNMILHLRCGFDSKNPPNKPSIAGATASLLQFNDYKVRKEFSDSLNMRLFTPEMDHCLDNWDDIRKLGGTTRFLHAVEAAHEAIQEAPAVNRKLLILLTDGVADDWEDALKMMIKMHDNSDGLLSFMVMGVAACSYYEDEFPVQATLKLMGEKFRQQLFMLSRDNERPRDLESVIVQPG